MMRAPSRLMHPMAVTELQNRVDGLIYDDHYAPDEAVRKALLDMMSDRGGAPPDAPTIVDSVLQQFRGVDWAGVDETHFEDLVQTARDAVSIVREHAKRRALVERIVRSVVHRER
jgi:hypothetical protein